jgi:hypothetical protein
MIFPRVIPELGNRRLPEIFIEGRVLKLILVRVELFVIYILGDSWLVEV